MLSQAHISQLATWKDTAENRPVPINCRLDQKDYFNYMSSVGEITLINPDHGNDGRLKLLIFGPLNVRTAYRCHVRDLLSL